MTPGALTYVALLRAVNVGRSNRVGMADVRRALESLGYRDVRTYLQSGNAVFSAASQPVGDLAREIAVNLRAECAIDVSVVVVDAGELAEIARDNPLLHEADVDEETLHLIVFDEAPDASRFAGLALPVQGGERAELRGRALYLALPQGMARTKLGNSYFERVLCRAGTARNWRTVSALLKMACEPAG